MMQQPLLKSRYDIVIAGGGMVGASLALLLSEHSRQQLNILLVESFPLGFNGQRELQYTPSFDARCTALSYGSRLIFAAVEVWPLLQQHVAAIDSIHVSRRGALASAVMDKSDVGWDALGYVVENPWLGATLLAALGRQGNLDVAAPATVTSIQCRPRDRALVIERHGETITVTTPLVVIADGAGSGLRRQLGIAVTEKEYRQYSLIANVSCRRPHRGRAFERFAEHGPVALLPLTDDERGEPRAAVVWNLPGSMAQQYLDMKEANLLAALQKTFGHRLGEFVRVGQRVLYPLRLMQAQEQVRSGIVVMGNAAHALHPVAGQGFNLALRDCARLAEVLCDAFSRRENLGELKLLQHYLRQQQADQQKTVSFSDRLPALFAPTSWPLSLLRDFALGTLDMMPSVKIPFIHHTAGMYDGAARGESHDRI